VIETKPGFDDGQQQHLALHDDIPIVPDSQAESPSPNLIRYQVANGAGDAVRFYQDEMPKNDWQVSSSHLIRPGVAVLSYCKDGRRATIIIHQDDSLRTRVMITIAQQA